jgi:hypothetical protein
MIPTQLLDREGELFYEKKKESEKVSSVVYMGISENIL